MAAGQRPRLGAPTALSLGTPPAGLPMLPSPPARAMRGPTPWCNWVIKRHMLAGAYPASLDDRDTEDILSTLLEAGVTTFVCLQAEVSLEVTESSWRSGRGLRPYIKDAQRILSHAHALGNARITQPKIDFLHLSIIDGSVTSDEAMTRLRDDCCARILRGEVLYIHCWGGHGRTGTLVCLILSMLYGMGAPSALHLCQAYHDTRSYPQHVKSPQTPIQRAQVQRIIDSREGDHAVRRRRISNLASSPPQPARPTAASCAIPRPSRVKARQADNGLPVGSIAARSRSHTSSVAAGLQGLLLEGSSAAGRGATSGTGAHVRNERPGAPLPDLGRPSYSARTETNQADRGLPRRSVLYT
mmetsp:Transcript_35444/g.90718  ORF Transcript_35444/g.90718 Transcript_35444/m.90718 type:complete len:357 (+) Transcript_35444:311-1381(+)